MKIISLSLLLLPFIFTIDLPGDCPQGINLLPMYGKVKKCKAQIEADSVFLKTCDNTYPDRKQAAKYLVSRGWGYFYKNKLDTAMFRFNQAWLLDSLNADTYWGMGNIEGLKKHYNESIPLFNHAIKLNPGNEKLYEGAASSLEQLFVQTKNVTES